MVLITFATILLITKYHTDIKAMTVLMVTSSILTVVTRPLIGKITQRLGEMQALALNYFMVSLLFIGYIFIENIWLIYLIYILDTILVGFDDIAISTYVGRITRQDELSSTLAVGSTLSHLIAVTIPIIGTFIWMNFGLIYPFLFGVLIVLSASVYALLEKRSVNVHSSSL